MISALFLSTLVYLFIGFFAGLMAGALGIGGGIIVVPALVFVFQHNQWIPEAAIMRVAAGTSLAVMVFTSIASLKAHLKFSDILWSVFNKLWPGILLGVVSGAWLAKLIPTHWLVIIFAVFLLCVAVKMAMDVQTSRVGHFPRAWVNYLISFVIGLKSGLLGIGGGVLIVPYLTYCGVTVRKIAAVSNLCTLLVGLVGASACMITGQTEMATTAYATGYVYWPAVLAVAVSSVFAAPLGAKLNYILPVKQLKYGFIVILFLTAIKMLV